MLPKAKAAQLAAKTFPEQDVMICTLILHQGEKTGPKTVSDKRPG